MLNKLIIHCDGASRNNPGNASIGVVIFDNKMNILKKYKECLGKATNNVAEYMSLIAGLKLAYEFTHDEVLVFMDSELVIKQMKGFYKIKNNTLKVLYSEAKNIEMFFSKVIYKNVSRENLYQKMADSLANESLDKL